jgi:hypothetical protein
MSDIAFEWQNTLLYLGNKDCDIQLKPFQKLWQWHYKMIEELTFASDIATF